MTLVHVFALPPVLDRRERFAADTWQREYLAGEWRKLPFVGNRDATTELDYPRNLPFMRDLVHAAVRGQKPNDIVVVTNADTCFAQGLGLAIVVATRKHGSCFAHRHDFRQLIRTQHPRNGKWYPGSDLFAFTVKWWGEHGGEYPDMLVGAEFVDCILRQLIKKHGGAELIEAIYHERHASAWEDPRVRAVDAANCWNRRLAKRWFAANHTDDNDPKTRPAAHKYRV